ncbi:hypothetical protein [Azospirillum aestuarii]|uniref:hypothetical protein n=1 Tax=Azospirillum aestuarii TaxID=2802052 RepID=UPI0011F23363
MEFIGSGGAWGLIAFIAVGVGLSNWLAIFALLGISAIAGIERQGLCSRAIGWAFIHYMIAIATSKLAHLTFLAFSSLI